MKPDQAIQALQILESALSAAIASGTFKNIHEANAVIQAFAVLSEIINKKDHVQETVKKP